MVEQEYSKNPTVFPASLILDKTSQNHTLNEWFVNEAVTMRRSEELSNSDLFYMLYGNSVPPDKDGSFLLPNERATEKDKDVYSLLVNESATGKDNLIQETLPRLVSVQEAIPWESSNQNMFDIKDYFDPMSENISDSYSEVQSPLSFWGSSHDLETLKIDDIFQVDKDDLVQSPTLAELNAIDESLFDSFDRVNIPLRHKNGKSQSLAPDLDSSGSACKRSSRLETSQIKTIPETSSVRVSSFPQKDTCEKGSAPKNQMRSDINSTEKKKDSSPNSATKSTEKANVALQVITKFRGKMHSSNESSVKKADVKVVENASDLLLEIKQESADSEDEEWSIEMDCDYSSDGDEESEEETEVNLPKYASANHLLQKKKSRYFWQYNIQSKGPKVKLEEKMTVSDNLSGISDPVFTSSNLIKGIKHAGKARRGDGNDLTPNPQKLFNIGLELEKLDSVIEGLVPANELPLNARMKSRKEKNKLASRACRLKKKAQHEANKLKLFGLRKEQKLLLGVIKQAKKVIKKQVDKSEHGKLLSSTHAKIAALCKKTHCTQVAGCSAEFVNNVLRTINQGDRTGGLDVEVNDE